MMKAVTRPALRLLASLGLAATVIGCAPAARPTPEQTLARHEAALQAACDREIAFWHHHPHGKNPVADKHHFPHGACDALTAFRHHHPHGQDAAATAHKHHHRHGHPRPAPN